MAVDTNGWALPGVALAEAPTECVEMAELRAAVDAVIALDPDVRPLAGLAVDLAALEVETRRLQAASSRALCSFDRRHGATSLAGLASTRDWVVAKLRVGRRAATARVKAAQGCFFRTGPLLDPMSDAVLDRTANSWLAGEVDAAHVAVVVGLDTLLSRDLLRTQSFRPHELDARRGEANALFNDAALATDPETLMTTTAYLRAQFAPEAALDAAAAMWDSRTLYSHQALDGMSHLRGLQTAEAATLTEMVLAQFGRRLGDEDTRLPGQRQHDAWANACEALVSAGLVCDTRTQESESSGLAGEGAEAEESRATEAAADLVAGPIAHIEVVCDVETLAGRSGAPAALLDGRPLDAGTARKLACDANLARVLTHGGSIVEHSGSRVATGNLRRRILMRDGNRCRFPGCQARLRHIHHLKHWAQGGPTISQNLVGLCWFHHDLIHHEGWELLGNPDYGELQAVPPRWEHPINRERRRRTRNASFATRFRT